MTGMMPYTNYGEQNKPVLGPVLGPAHPNPVT